MLTIEAIAKLAYNARVGVLTYNTAPSPLAGEWPDRPLTWDELPAEHADRPWAIATAEAEVTSPMTPVEVQAFIRNAKGEENFSPEHATFIMVCHTLHPFYSANGNSIVEPTATRTNLPTPGAFRGVGN